MSDKKILVGDMSRETAIGILKLMLEAMEAYDSIAPTSQRRNAVQMAIASLETDETYQLEYERTTKNDLGVDCISRKAVLDGFEKYSKGSFAYGCVWDYVKNLPSVTPQLSSGLDKNSKKLEKNFGESDCISRKEAISWIENLRTLNEHYHPNAKDNHLIDCDSAIDHLKQVPSVLPKVKWIPVSERLPDTYDEVLCWYEYYHWSQEKVLPEYGVGRYFKETKAWFGEVANGKDIRVIAWMPLPTPFEPQESEDKEHKDGKV